MTREEGAERLQRLTTELVRRYLFRDWNKVCCYGISISQSHILDILAEEGEFTMQELARRMYKSTSTMTRVAGQLVRKGYVRRRQNSEDGRVVHLGISAKGRTLLASIHGDLVETQKAVLDQIPPNEWRSVFQALEALAEGALRWQHETCVKKK